MQQETLLKNSVVIIGCVSTKFVFSHEIYGEGFYTFFLETDRLSEASDYLPITISERLIDKEGIPIGKKVKVTGQIRSYNSFVEEEKRNRLILTVFARDIEFDFVEEGTNPNSVYLNGYICKPPIYRTTPFGREIADLLIAVNRSYNKSDYIPCIAWGRNARFAGKLNVGDNIKISGRMQSRTYQKKKDDGEIIEKTAYEVSVSKLEYGTNLQFENEAEK